MILQQELFAAILEEPQGTSYRRNLVEDRYDYVSPAVERLTGFSVSEFKGLGLAELLARIHPDDLPYTRVKFETAIQNRQPEATVEYRFLSKNGSYKWVGDHFMVVRDPEGAPLYMFGIMQDITRLRRDRAELERQLISALNSLPVGIMIANREGRINTVNRMAAVIWGGQVPFAADYSEYERFEGWFSESGKRVEPGEWPLAETIRSGAAVTGEIINIKKFDGSYATISNSAAPIRDAQGRITGGFVVMQDITGIRKIEEKLRERQEDCRRTADGIKEGICMINREGQATFVNRKAADMLGRLREDIVGRPFFDSLDGSDQGSALKRIGLDSGGPGAGNEFKFIRKDGSPLWVIMNSTPMLGKTGDTVGFLCMMTDITERKLMEEELRQNEERLRVAQKAARVGVFDWDLVTGKIIWNEQMEELFGFSLGAFNHSYEAWIERVHPEDAGRLKSLLKEWLQSGRTEESYEYRICRRDGKVIWLQMNAVLVYGSGAKPLKMIGASIDITRSKRTEDELLKSQERMRALASELEKAWEEQKKCLAHELHDELGQVLTGLKMDLCWLEKKIPESPPTVRKKIQKMMDYLSPMAKHIQSIAIQLRPGVLDEGLIPALEWEIEERQKREGIAFNLDARLDADPPEEVKTALFRTAQDAIALIVSHSRASRVEVSLEAERNMFSLAIRDNGIGIPEKELQGTAVTAMRERILALGGEFRLVHDKGAHFSILVPTETGKPGGRR